MTSLNRLFAAMTLALGLAFAASNANAAPDDWRPAPQPTTPHPGRHNTAPEPLTLLGLGGGAAALAYLRRRAAVN